MLKNMTLFVITYVVAWQWLFVVRPILLLGPNYSTGNWNLKTIFVSVIYAI